MRVPSLLLNPPKMTMNWSNETAEWARRGSNCFLIFLPALEPYISSLGKISNHLDRKVSNTHTSERGSLLFVSSSSSAGCEPEADLDSPPLLPSLAPLSLASLSLPASLASLSLLSCFSSLKSGVVIPDFDTGVWGALTYCIDFKFDSFSADGRVVIC